MIIWDTRTTDPTETPDSLAPARGLLVGLLLSLVGFWLPLGFWAVGR